MDNKIQALIVRLQKTFGDKLQSCVARLGEVTIVVAKKDILDVCKTLRDDEDLFFELMIDLCGVDYSAYGEVEWSTDDATGAGFSRGVSAAEREHHEPHSSDHLSGKHIVDHHAADKAAKVNCFSVVYHLLSIKHNHRVRVKTAPDSAPLVVDSVIDVWNVANWYEREAFDLFGIMFDGHPDLRRLLTDYGFIGHPFRKDFPISGNVEMRYDAEKRRVVYEPVSIEPRVLVPRVIRDDHRYLEQREQPSQSQQKKESS